MGIGGSLSFALARRYELERNDFLAIRIRHESITKLSSYLKCCIVTDTARQIQKLWPKALRDRRPASRTSERPTRTPTQGWITSDKSIPLHPFLLALASVLALMANSLNQVTFAHVAPALAGVLAFALAVYLMVSGLRRRLDARTAVIASIWIAGSLFYVSLFGPLNTLLGGGFAMVRTLLVVLLLLTVLTAGVLYLPHTLVNVANMVLNGIAVVLFATPAWQAAAYEWRNGAARGVYDADHAVAAMPQIAATGGGEQGASRPPNIYHFVFDRYPSEGVLKEYYGHDDSATGRFLEHRGFYVARNSHANYHRTAHSLASTFYMDYLDLLAGTPKVAGDNWQPVHAMLRDHRAARFLKARGYDFIQFGSWWTGTFRNHRADVNRPHGFSEFNMLYLRRTMLRSIFQALPDWPLTRRLDWDSGQCHRVAAQIEEIKATSAREKPTYVFAHFLVPHDPYNFTTNGRCLTLQESNKRGLRQGYLDQVAYAGRIIEELVTELQADDRSRPVILIQSDEGPFPDREAGVPWQEQPDDLLRIKTGILNAYYFPGGQYGELSSATTPVNSYRVLFNALFGSNFDLLPDRVFVHPGDKQLYEFHDVTARVRRPGG